MNKKSGKTLLNRPLKAFAAYALLILICSIPVYYLVVDFIWLKELDEHNYTLKKQLEKGFNNKQLSVGERENLVKIWSRLQPGTVLNPVKGKQTKADRTYTISRKGNFGEENEMERFRGLMSHITIGDKLYRVRIETNVEEADETILAITLVTLSFFLMLVGGFIFLNRFLSAGLWKPFRQTLEKLKTFDLASRREFALDRTDIKEFEELHAVLYKLIEKNRSVYEQQKHFIENAAHELQTPLAVLKSKTNLLLQSEPITQEQAEIIQAIELPLSRMSRINKNLLLLAKIENDQFQQAETLELSALLEENLLFLQDYFISRELILVKDLPQELEVSCNKMLLEILVSNLLINSVIHNEKKGGVEVELSGRTLKVANSGNKALDPEKLFRRFVISSSEKTNSGLGLSIIHEICKRYAWKVDYAFEKNRHIFSVYF